MNDYPKAKKKDQDQIARRFFETV